VELGRSASRTFAHLVFVCAHGGNFEPAARATTRLRAESRDVLLFRPAWDGDAHAGRTETSMLLHLAPARVRMASAVPGDTRPLAEIWPLLRAGGVRAVSESGVLGDPAGATAGAGLALLDGLSAALIREVAGWHPEVRG
jgi:mycofactocin precursor peptide peptidase